MNIKELSANVSDFTGISLSTGIMLSFINSLESDFFNNIIEEYRKTRVEFSDKDKFIKFNIQRDNIKEMIVYDENNNSVFTLEKIKDNINIYTEDDIPNDCMYAIKNEYGNGYVEIMYRYVPTLKTVDNINNQILDITRYGEQWSELYLFHLIHKAYYSTEDYAQANNNAIMFNDVKSKFMTYYYKSSYYNEAVKKVESRW